MAEDATFTKDDIAAVVNAQTEPAAASSSAEPSTASHADAATIVPSAAEPSKPQDGPIPLDRHQAILEKTRREYEQKLARLSWAESYSPDQVGRALALADLREQERTAARQASPDLKLQTEDGTPLGDVLEPWVQHRIDQALAKQRQELDREMGPIRQFASRSQIQDELASQIEAALNWEGFTEHVSAIAEALETAAQAGEYLSLHDAYITTVVPKLKANRESIRAEERKAILDELNTTSQRAKDDLNPVRTPAASRKRDADKSWGELIEEEVAARSRASA